MLFDQIHQQQQRRRRVSQQIVRYHHDSVHMLRRSAMSIRLHTKQRFVIAWSNVLVYSFNMVTVSFATAGQCYYAHIPHTVCVFTLLTYFCPCL